jgi:hypothetical protein
LLLVQWEKGPNIQPRDPNCFTNDSSFDGDCNNLYRSTVNNESYLEKIILLSFDIILTKNSYLTSIKSDGYDFKNTYLINNLLKLCPILTPGRKGPPLQNAPKILEKIVQFLTMLGKQGSLKDILLEIVHNLFNSENHKLVLEILLRFLDNFIGAGNKDVSAIKKFKEVFFGKEDEFAAQPFLLFYYNHSLTSLCETQVIEKGASLFTAVSNLVLEDSDEDSYNVLLRIYHC